MHSGDSPDSPFQPHRSCVPYFGLKPSGKEGSGPPDDPEGPSSGTVFQFDEFLKFPKRASLSERYYSVPPTQSSKMSIPPFPLSGICKDQPLAAKPKAQAPCLPPGVENHYGWADPPSDFGRQKSMEVPPRPRLVEDPPSFSYDGATRIPAEHGSIEGLDALSRILQQLGGKSKGEVRSVGVPPWPLLMHLPKWKEELQSNLVIAAALVLCLAGSVVLGKRVLRIRSCIILKVLNSLIRIYRTECSK